MVEHVYDWCKRCAYFTNCYPQDDGCHPGPYLLEPACGDGPELHPINEDLLVEDGLENTRHCSICPAETDGAPLCDQCAVRLRDNCILIHLAMTAGACVGSGTVDNLRRDEALLERQTEWEANNARPE